MKFDEYYCRHGVSAATACRPHHILLSFWVIYGEGSALRQLVCRHHSFLFLLPLHMQCINDLPLFQHEEV